MRKLLLQTVAETAETLIERVVKNYALQKRAFADPDEAPAIGMTSIGDVETDLGTLYYKLEVDDEPFDEDDQNHETGDNQSN